jgi:hypothetical protein
VSALAWPVGVQRRVAGCHFDGSCTSKTIDELSASTSGPVIEHERIFARRGRNVAVWCAHLLQLCALVGKPEDRPVEAIVTGEGPQQRQLDDVLVERADPIEIDGRPSDADRTQRPFRLT